jgi:phospholipid N-methyltransferase
VSSTNQAVLFAKNFFKYPHRVGSIIPSSRFLIKTLLSEIDWDKTRVIVEYGPGVGTITREILRRMHPHCTLVVIEMNDEFVRHLKETLIDRRLRVVHGTATQVGAVLARLAFPAADYIISSIPFTTMPKATRWQVIQESRRALRDGGRFIVLQFTPTVASHLEPVFTQVEFDFELLNFPPALIFHCSG